jgi:hypothetical protein
MFFIETNTLDTTHQKLKRITDTSRFLVGCPSSHLITMVAYEFQGQLGFFLDANPPNSWICCESFGGAIGDGFWLLLEEKLSAQRTDEVGNVLKSKLNVMKEKFKETPHPALCAKFPSRGGENCRKRHKNGANLPLLTY